LEATGTTPAELEQQFAEDARRSVKAGFILDKLAADEELGLEPAELTSYVTQQAYQLGVAPDRLAKELADRGQLGSVAADVLRTKALGLLADRARVTDESGRVIDLSAVAAEVIGAEAAGTVEAAVADVEAEAGEAEVIDETADEAVEASEAAETGEADETAEADQADGE
jgi:trigger factor